MIYLFTWLLMALVLSGCFLYGAALARHPDLAQLKVSEVPLALFAFLAGPPARRRLMHVLGNRQDAEDSDIRRFKATARPTRLLPKPVPGDFPDEGLAVLDGALARVEKVRKDALRYRAEAQSYRDQARELLERAEKVRREAPVVPRPASPLYVVYDGAPDFASLVHACRAGAFSPAAAAESMWDLAAAIDRLQAAMRDQRDAPLD